MVGDKEENKILAKDFMSTYRLTMERHKNNLIKN